MPGDDQGVSRAKRYGTIEYLLGPMASSRDFLALGRIHGKPGWLLSMLSEAKYGLHVITGFFGKKAAILIGSI
jgi:hypothetical protein